MFGWHVPAPDQAMLVSGGRQRGDASLPFKVVTGHGAFAVPLVRRVSFMTLALQESQVIEECVTQQGIALQVKAVIAFKVGADHASISSAAQRFLADQRQMSTLTGQIFAGHLRSIVGSMTVEAIIRERQTLAEQVLEASKTEMANLGLAVDSLQIQSIDDLGSGYIRALAAVHVARVNRDAKIAQAEADQAAAEAEQSSQRNQAEYQRQTAVTKAGYQAEVDQAQARAGQAGPLAAAQAQQGVLAEQAKVAARNAELVQAQLVGQVVKPAEADADKVRILAQAEADRVRMVAEAASAQNRIALDQQMINQLPELIRAAAEGLKGANVTVLNGAEGLNGTVAALAAQGSTILRTVLGELGGPTREPSPPLPAPAGPTGPAGGPGRPETGGRDGRP